jgi:hypothetical protein
MKKFSPVDYYGSGSGFSFRSLLRRLGRKLYYSAYLGICYGLLSRPALAAAEGKNLAYLFGAYPLLIPTAFVESWITATYIGGMAMIVLYYFAIKITISMIARGHQSA